MQKITNAKIALLFHALNGINNIENPNFTRKAYYGISRNLDLISGPVKTRDKELLRIYQEHGSKNPRLGYDGVPEENITECQKAVEELDQIEIEVELHKVDEKEFDFVGNHVKGNIWTGLIPILNLEGESGNATRRPREKTS